MNADDDVWTKSKWSMEQLDRKSVEFWIPQGQQQIHGVGQFLAKEDPKGHRGLLVVTLCRFLQKTTAETLEVRPPLEQAAVERIERHPDPSVADFQLK